MCRCWSRTASPRNSGFNGATPERGWKGSTHRRRPEGRLASMGPPPKEGGRLEHDVGVGHLHTLQWGHPRKRVEGSACGSGRLTAPRQLQWGHPRKRVEGPFFNSVSRSSSELQWGHPRKRVEGELAARAEAILVAGLQWGHPRKRVEGSGTSTTRGLSPELQWGHPRKRVEGSRLTGAQSAGCVLQWGHPRKRVEDARGAAVRAQRERGVLQWGHPRKRVEGEQLVRLGFARHEPASMGPPPKEGGRSPLAIHRCQLVVLQWGHPRKRVEGRHAAGPARRTPDARLQWGHPRKRVEGRARCTPRGRATTFASMGPPPKEGGRVTAIGRGSALILELQWGHPRKRVEGAVVDVQQHAALEASMGPPPKEGGRRGRVPCAESRPQDASMGPPPKEGGRAGRPSPRNSTEIHPPLHARNFAPGNR